MFNIDEKGSFEHDSILGISTVAVMFARGERLKRRSGNGWHCRMSKLCTVDTVVSFILRRHS